ncbi:LCP family protein [Streptomyces sp. NBC_00669]|uniref:LCP family protein n=1 Tax=Streptomyces sp. NBC_00669 TaxID=2976011 RepID=UPI002E37E1FC|nr:LCP family protein [Streptomyces sp. NBC_00669]
MAEGQQQRGTSGGPWRRPARGETVWPARPPLPAAVRRRYWLLRGLTFGLSLAVLVAAGAGTLVYLRLNGNIRDMPLFGGIGGNAGHERPDAFGRTPVNVLVIGSDTRADPADCKLGGDCGPGRNADVAMVLHLSADRSHATVLSIPRDTVTDLPACRAPKGGTAAAHRGPVNSSLQYGPGCTVAAVHALTGIPIDHFVMADFAGVVRMSDAVGGVPVCVDRDMYDPYSHLKLARGRHDLRGQAALEFLRTRHAFGDGSDLGRTSAQHLFLSALGTRLRRSGSLTDPAGMLSLADTATKSLTVDPGLAAVPKLIGLADDVRKVPSARVDYATMPTVPDPDDGAHVVPAAAARGVFAAIADDTPPRKARAQGSARVDESFDGPDGSATPAAGRPARAKRSSGPACVKVATAATVSVHGIAMNPTAAYAATPHVPVSAR